MTADRFAMRVRVPASTANLGSGFDVLGLALQMYLEVEAVPGGEGLEITNTGLGADELPTDRNHLVYRMIAEHAGDDLPRGLRLTVNNGIPLTRGFGSSASAIAAGISIGMWIKNGRPPERTPVLEAATRVEGHPDNVSACILGGLTVSGLVDDQVFATSLRIPHGIRAAIRPSCKTFVTRPARPNSLTGCCPPANSSFVMRKAWVWPGVRSSVSKGSRFYMHRGSPFRSMTGAKPGFFIPASATPMTTVLRSGCPSTGT